RRDVGPGAVRRAAARRRRGAAAGPHPERGTTGWGESAGMTIREFVRTIWTGKYYVLAAVLVVVAGALFYVDRQETQYRATATVQLYGVQSVQGGESLVEVTVATDADDVTSPEVAEAAATALGEQIGRAVCREGLRSSEASGGV